MYDIILAFITAFTLTYFAIPSIIHVANEKRLMDEPGDRHSHTVSTPSLGGIGIFAGMIFSIVLWTPFNVFGDLQYILCAFILIFLIGVKDDILPMSPRNKLIGELLAATILVFKSNVKITSFYGLFGIGDLSDMVAVPLSIFTILVIINAFNLIDGINGLSGSIGVLISVTLGYWFFSTFHNDLAIVAFSLAGALIAFLKYNYSPAKIFMGDTGSLLVGLVCSILAIKFIEFHRDLPLDNPFYMKSVPAVAIGILILPLYDTARVFLTRALKGHSPFYPDRTHIHHLLIDTGLSHMQATYVLVFVNFLFIVMVFKFQAIGTLPLLALTIGLATILSAWLYYFVKKKKAKTATS